MLVVVQRVNVQDAVSRGDQPVAIIRRNKASDVDAGRVPMTAGRTFDSGEWRIAQERIVVDRKPEYSRDLGKSTDGLISVPLFSYNVPEASAEILVTLGLQLGAWVTLLQPNAWGDPVGKLVIVQGNVFTRPDGQEGYQVWLGFAFRLGKNA